MTNKQAIEILREMQPTIAHYDKQVRQQTAIRMAIEALRERKTGKWIRRHYLCDDEKHDTFICSECRDECCYDAETGVSAEDYKYCPNCGAKMEVDE